VLVDSSFLLLCAEKGRDFISLAEESLRERLECYVLEDVLNELGRLSSKKGKRGALASVALRIAEKMKVIKSSSDLGTDEKLIEESKRRGMVIATIDGDLIKKSKEKGLPILTIKRDQSVLLIGRRP